MGATSSDGSGEALGQNIEGEFSALKFSSGVGIPTTVRSRKLSSRTAERDVVSTRPDRHLHDVSTAHHVTIILTRSSEITYQRGYYERYSQSVES